MDIPLPPPPPSLSALHFVSDEIIEIEKLFLRLNQNNLESTAQKVSKIMEVQPSCSLFYEFYITQFTYMSYFTRNIDAILYILFLNLLSNSKNLNHSKLLQLLTIYLYQMNTYQAKCLLKEMNKHEMIPSKLVYYVENIINKTSYESKEENHLLNILRNDNLEELQEMASQNGFYVNQIVDRPLYEKYSFIYEQKKIFC